MSKNPSGNKFLSKEIASSKKGMKAKVKMAKKLGK